MISGRHILETLEDRIAPASASGSGIWGASISGQSYTFNDNTGDLTVIGQWPTSETARSFTYKDVDGDDITIKFSKSLMEDAPDSLFTFIMEGDGRRTLQSINLENLGWDAAKLKGLSISVTADQWGEGDGKVNVGSILAGGVDLGAVSIDGILGQIISGDSDVKTSGLRSLRVDSLGLGEGISSDQITSIIHGSLDKLVITHDLNEALLSTTGGGALKSAVIGGSLEGGDAQRSGTIDISGKIAKITVGGVLQGGDGKYSGSILAGGDIVSAKIVGSIKGGNGAEGYSGCIQTQGKIGSIVVGGVLVGGDAEHSGKINSTMGMTKVDIKGGISGDGTNSGRVETSGSIGRITVGGLLGGGLGSGVIHAMGDITSAKITGISGGTGSGGHCGNIQANGKIVSIVIEGYVQGGMGEYSGMIISYGNMTKVEIEHDILGGDGGYAGRVECGGQISLLKVGGSVAGGSAEYTGSVSAAGAIKSVIVKDSMYGHDKEGTGYIRSGGNIDKVTVGGMMSGGTGKNSGNISAIGKIKTAFVDDGLYGSDGENSGSVSSFGGFFKHYKTNGPQSGGSGWRSGCFADYFYDDGTGGGTIQT